MEWAELVFTRPSEGKQLRHTNVSNHNLSYHPLFNREIRSSGLPINAEPLIKQTQEEVWLELCCFLATCFLMESFLMNIVFFVSNTIMPAIPSKVESEDSSIFVQSLRSHSREYYYSLRSFLPFSLIHIVFMRAISRRSHRMLLSVSSGCPLTFQPEAFQDLFELGKLFIQILIVHLS